MADQNQQAGAVPDRGPEPNVPKPVPSEVGTEAVERGKEITDVHVDVNGNPEPPVVKNTVVEAENEKAKKRAA